MKPNQEWILDLRDGTYLKGKGPDELIQAATKEAGAVWGTPGEDDFALYANGTWAKVDFSGWHGKTIYIPAPKPEPEKPCDNCQNVKPGRVIERDFDPIRGVSFCSICRRLSHEWTYAKPEEKPCTNCQGIKPEQAVWSTICTHYTRCNKCGRPESEWTYAPSPDPGGIGGGGTGGPL